MEVKVRQAPSGGLVRYFERFCSIVFFTGFDHPVDDPYELVGTSHDPFGFTQPRFHFPDMVAHLRFGFLEPALAKGQVKPPLSLSRKSRPC